MTYRTLLLTLLLCTGVHAAELNVEPTVVEPTTYETLATHMLPNTSPIKGDAEVISEQDAYKTALHILHTAHLQTDAPPEGVVNEVTASDLDLFFYSPQHPDHTMLNKLKRTETILGTCQLGKMLLTPQTDPSELARRQHIIRLLVENEGLRTQLQQMLEEFCPQEHNLLSLWNPNDPIYSANVSEMFYSGDLRKKKSSTRFDVNSYANIIGSVANPVLTTIAMNLAASAVEHTLRNPPAHTGEAGPGNIMSRALQNLSAKVSSALNYLERYIPAPSMGQVRVAIFALSAYSIYASVAEIITNLRVRTTLIKNIRNRFMGLRAFSTMAQNMTTWASEHKAFTDNVPSMEAILRFTRVQHSPANRFLKTLSSSAFSGKQRALGRVGPVLAALPQFLHLKDQFCSALSTVAELDAYLSIAKLYLEFKTKPRGYCFAQFDTTSTTPRLSYTDFWHPSLPAERAVPNSIALGGNDSARNVILTGPNAAGKSTLSKALVLTALLAQTLTITPASSVELTPFTKINTYLNVVQDLGERSAHRAEVQRSKELINEIVELPSDKFSLTIMDEMYRNTDPNTGAASSFGVAEQLGKKENSILILATHYSRLTALAKHTDGKYSNYKVEANKNEDGTFTYPYQVVPGANDTVIVFDMMANEGFNDDILNYAYEHLADIQRRDKGTIERLTDDAQDLVDSYVTNLRKKIEASKRGE